VPLDGHMIWCRIIPSIGGVGHVIGYAGIHDGAGGWCWDPMTAEKLGTPHD